MVPSYFWSTVNISLINAWGKTAMSTYPRLALLHALTWASLAWGWSGPRCGLWHWSNPTPPTTNPPQIPAISKEGPKNSASLLIFKDFSHQTSAQAWNATQFAYFFPLSFLPWEHSVNLKIKQAKLHIDMMKRQKHHLKSRVYSESPGYNCWIGTQLHIFLI